MIDEYADQLIADGPVQQRRDHGGIDAAGQAQQHLALAHLRAHARDGVFDDVADAPQRLAAADLAHEALEQMLALQRVRDFGMELHGVEAPRFIDHGGERRVGALRHRGESRRQRLDAVAVAHPHVEHGAALRVLAIEQPVEQLVGRDAGDFGVAELTVIAGQHLAAELLRHGLHAVADAEHGHAELEHRLRCARRFLVGDRFGTTREDDALRLPLADVVVADVPGQDFAVDAELAHAARDELGVLGAEVEDQDARGVDVGLRVRTHSSPGCSFDSPHDTR